MLIQRPSYVNKARRKYEKVDHNSLIIGQLTMKVRYIT